MEMQNKIEHQIRMLLLDTRASKGLDIRELSRRSGVGVGVISRIENGLSTIIFGTLVRLCYGLEIYPEILSKHIGIDCICSKKRLPPEYSVDAMPKYLTTADLEAFRLAYRFNTSAARDDLIALWTAVLESGTFITQQKAHELANGNALQIATTQINKALENVQESLEYPLMNTRALWDVFCEGGTISLVDAGCYLRETRRRAGKKLVDLQEVLQMSRNVIARIENGGMERIRFSDIVRVDQLFEERGCLLSMFWAAFEYQSGVEAIALTKNAFYYNEKQGAISSLSESDFNITPLQDTLLRISRWYFYFTIENDIRYWIDQERQKWKQLASSKGWKILITTGPSSEESLTAEVYYQDEQWAELSEFGKHLTLYPRADKMPWKLEYNDALAMLETARKKLNGVPEQ